MNYSIKKEKALVEIKLKLEDNEWVDATNKAYEQSKAKYEVQGFRKGKAPKKAIENAYGVGVFYDDAIEVVLQEYYSKIIKDEKIDAIAYPNMIIDKISETELEMTFNVDIIPEFELGAYTGLEIEKAEVKVSEEHIDMHINEMAEKHARKIEVTDRAILEGDIVNFDFEGSVDGKLFDGGTAKGYELQIGSHQFIDGFESQMVGMNLNEEKDLKVKFPDDYPSEDLKGKDANFKVKINKIEVKEMPEINDEWASNVSEFETLKELRDDIAKHDEEHAKHHAEEEDTTNLIEKIAENTSVEIPESLVQDELNYIVEDYTNRLAYQGMKFEDYLKAVNITLDEFKEKQKPSAEKNCKVRLVLQKIIEKEKITFDEKDIENKLEEIAKMYNQTVEEIKKNFPKEQLNYLRNEILMDKLIAFLKENNKFIEK